MFCFITVNENYFIKSCSMLKKYNLKTNQVTNLILTNTKKSEIKINIMNTNKTFLFC